jgi:hypothetical protein
MNRYFQYLAGERKGEVVVFDKLEVDDDINYVCFKDGARCNEEFILPLNETNWEGKLMAEISDHSNVWKISEEWVGRQEEKYQPDKDGEPVCIQPFVKGRKQIIAIPPKRTESKFIGNHQTQLPIQKQANQNTSDPVWIMLDKAKKYDINVPMELVISLPTKSLYDVAKESFDNGGEKVIDYIIHNLDNTKIKNSLKVALLSAYEEKKPLINSKEPLGFEPTTIEPSITSDQQIQENK